MRDLLKLLRSISSFNYNSWQLESEEEQVCLGEKWQHTGKAGRRNRNICISVLCMSLSLLPACTNFSLANPGPSLYPFLDEPCFFPFCLCYLSAGTWLPLSQRDFPCGVDKRLSLSKHFDPVEVQPCSRATGSWGEGLMGICSRWVVSTFTVH